MKVGTAQGCPLSLALVNVFIQDLINDLNESGKGVITLAYADYIVVVADSAEKLQQVQIHRALPRRFARRAHRALPRSRTTPFLCTVYQATLQGFQKQKKRIGFCSPTRPYNRS